MSDPLPTSMRRVTLIDVRLPDRPATAASLYRDFPAEKLDVIEMDWANARQVAADAEQAVGLAPLEHAHWDWRNKRDSIKTGHHLAVVVECEGDLQGAMAVLRTPRAARLGTGHVVYVDYVEAAPWNLKAFASQPRFLGVGTVLIADAIRLSMEMQLGGAIGLHSLPQAEQFYAQRCGMTRVGHDSNYFDLTYFEQTPHGATDWLAAIGESA
jgi:hypothetical protein